MIRIFISFYIITHTRYSIVRGAKTYVYAKEEKEKK